MWRDGYDDIASIVTVKMWIVMPSVELTEVTAENVPHPVARLDLSWNAISHLTDLPLASPDHLETLEIADNRLTMVGPFMVKLPNLKAVRPHLNVTSRWAVCCVPPLGRLSHHFVPSIMAWWFTVFASIGCCCCFVTMW